MSSKNQKRALLVTLGLCLIIPFLSIPGEAFHFRADSNLPPSDREIMNASEEMFITDFCPTGDVLEVCYQTAITTVDFCNCQEIQKSNLLFFEANPTYNFLIWQKGAVWRFLGIAAILLFLLFAINIAYLNYLIATSQKSTLEINGEKVTLLRSNKMRAVASFYLINKYIIWQNEMNDLEASERQAILWHELAHIKNRDTWIKLLLNFTQLIWLVNPVFYLLKREMERLSEFVADEFAVEAYGNPRAYAELLFKMKTQSLPPAISSAFTGNLLKERIKHLVQPQQAAHPAFSFIRVAFMASLLVVCSYSILPQINYQLGKLEVYQDLLEQHESNGGIVFCKHCHLNH